MTEPFRSDKPRKLAKARAYKASHRAEILEWQRQYNAARLADPKRREKKLLQDRASAKRHYAARRAYDKARDKVKVNARTNIRCRIWRGTMERKPCAVCGEPKSHAHHHDYIKPLEVRWLCSKHHKEVHHV